MTTYTRAAERFALYTPEFAADPHRVYRQMRDFGPLVPVDLQPGVPATLVIGHALAVEVLHDPVRFPADPRVWQQGVDPGCPILPMVGYRANALRSAGHEHARFRASNKDALDPVLLHQLGTTVARISRQAINRFAHTGEVDLLAAFVKPVVLNSISTEMGVPPELARPIGESMAKVFEGIDAAAANELLMRSLDALIELKRARPGPDITTRLLQHRTRLSPEELAEQCVTLFGAGYEPLKNLIANTQLRMLSDQQFRGTVSSGMLTVRDAMDEALFTDPPMANYCLSYPPAPVNINGHVLPAHQPVVISMAAANNDPALGDPKLRLGNRAHLAFSAGPHACPAQDASLVIARTALEELIDALTDLHLAVPAADIRWRPGPFHRALQSLPVRFTPIAQLPEH
ncbi:cytochrome P450 [Streptomyces sp. OspMP-M43]|uniref:cytochrome P450 n=1 Tax=Streptomyces sp. OspMP-M43 TaxID=1839781 RepID=UPI00081B923F|nr:cytochrome P450 [Streptomyces sp. OspMP-M43]SCD37953.1 Cytochrome P450 [Streptomyces sp. OspMP-M43]